MIVFLSENDVQTAITMPETLTIVEAAFRDYALEQATLLPRVSQTMPGATGMFRILGATLPRQEMFGLKTLTGFPGRRLDHEVYFAILIFEMGSGALRAVISANYLTGLRTGAASGVAAKYLARADASSLGIVGAGVQAWYQAEALCAVRDIRTAKVFSRNKSKAEAFALRLQAMLSVDAVAVDSAEEAVRDSDLVIAATSSYEPIIQGAWLKPGTHVSGIGANTPLKKELDPTCFERARVVADSREQVMAECGDLRGAIEGGTVKADVVYAELGELAAGLKEGRASAEEVTIFKSVGLGLQDIAVAAALLGTAKPCRVGTPLDPFALSVPLAEIDIDAQSLLNKASVQPCNTKKHNQPTSFKQGFQEAQ
jgi:alanine dehydrogenase